MFEVDGSSEMDSWALGLLWTVSSGLHLCCMTSRMDGPSDGYWMATANDIVPPRRGGVENGNDGKDSGMGTI